MTVIPHTEFRTRKVEQSRFDVIQFKATHNSYEKRALLDTQLRFQKEHPARFGCRGLEFDLHQGAGGFPWSVKHAGGDDDQDFRDYLTQLSRWSRDRPRHDVITLTLDLKAVRDSREVWPDRFDAYLMAQFDETLLVPPGEVIQGDIVRWPRMVDLRGRFVFCLSGKEAFKSSYSRKPERLCFADRAHNRVSLERADFANDSRIFVNLQRQHWQRTRSGPQLPDGYVSSLLPSGYVSRIYLVRRRSQWKEFTRLGVNILAADKISAKWGTFESPHPFSPKSIIQVA